MMAVVSIPEAMPSIVGMKILTRGWGLSALRMSRPELNGSEALSTGTRTQ
jgi:hypothetical protein